MKIEIDLNEILGDPEYGVETLQESVKRQVVAGLTQKIQSGIKEKIDREVAIAIDQSIKKNIETLTPQLFKEMLDAEYTPVDRYGDRKNGQTTNMRKQLIATIHEQMVYKKVNYDSDKNPFTRTVDAVLSDNVALFKKDFDKLVNEMFTKECFEYARSEMKKKLEIK